MVLKEKLYSKIYIPYVTLLILTFATHLPKIGRKISGASRWIGVGPIGVQPAEFLKIFTILFFVSLLTKKFSNHEINQLKTIKDYSLSKKDLLLLLLAPISILAQKDLGTTIVLIAGIISILFIGGFPKRYFILLLSSLSLLLFSAVIFEPYRIVRIMTFLNPFQDPLGAGFQVIQSFVAVANGGIFGRGIGESQQKLFFLPEAHTDFILAVISEELGFVGVLVLCLLFIVLFYALLRLILYSKSIQDRLLISGIFAMLVTTTIINMAVVAGALPTKGLPLPFISNGGSALIGNYFLIGLCAQISKRIYDQMKNS